MTIFCVTQKHTFQRQCFMRRGVLLLPHLRENRGSQLFLRVGDKIWNTNRMNLDGSISVIIEFKRGKVLCTNNVIIFPSEDDLSIDLYHVERNKAWYAITTDHQIFIQHNPKLTCAICNELHHVAVKRHTANENRLAAVTAMVNYNR